MTTETKSASAKPAKKAAPKTAAKAARKPANGTAEGATVRPVNVDVTERLRVQAADAMDKARDGWQSVQQFGEEAADTLSRTRDAAQTGAFELNNEMLSFTQGFLNDRIDAFRALTQAKSLREAIDIESGFVRKSLHAYVDYAHTMNTVATKATSEAVEPITQGLGKLFGKKAA